MTKKPKFKVGQRVVVRDTDACILIATRALQGECGWVYWTQSGSVGFLERELRPLTAREQGPRPGRSKR